VPERVLTNADLAAMLGTAIEPFVSETLGIRERHVCAPDESTADLAEHAARRALAAAGLAPADVDLLIVATDTPEYVSPATQYQRAGELVGVERTVAGVAPFAQLDPGIMLKFDVEQIAELYQEVTGAPAKILRSKEDYAALREQQQQAQAAAAMPEQMATAAGGAKDGAQAMKLLQGGAQGA
jgi:hypothetical protein